MIQIETGESCVSDTRLTTSAISALISYTAICRCWWPASIFSYFPLGADKCRWNFLELFFLESDYFLQDFIMIELTRVIHKSTTPYEATRDYKKRTAPFNDSFTSNRVSFVLTLLSFFFVSCVLRVWNGRSSEERTFMWRCFLSRLVKRWKCCTNQKLRKCFWNINQIVWKKTSTKFWFF